MLHQGLFSVVVVVSFVVAVAVFVTPWGGGGGSVVAVVSFVLGVVLFVTPWVFFLLWLRFLPL